MNEKLKAKIEAAKAAKLAKKLYKVVDISGTKYLPVPLELDEIVEWIEDREEGKYIKVRHGKDKKAVSVFNKTRFKRYIEKPTK